MIGIAAAPRAVRAEPKAGDPDLRSGRKREADSDAIGMPTDDQPAGRRSRLSPAIQNGARVQFGLAAFAVEHPELIERRSASNRRARGLLPRRVDRRIGDRPS